MDISNKIRDLRGAVDKIAAEEKLVKARLGELKTLIAEKKKQEENLASLKKEEEELLKML